MEIENKYPDTEKVILSYMLIEAIGHNIVRFELRHDLQLNMEKAMEMTEICKKMYSGNIYKSLKVVAYKMKIDEDVLTYLASASRKDLISSEAVVVNSSALQFLGNFYLRIKKPIIKTKIFTNEENAIAWLKNQ